MNAMSDRKAERKLANALRRLQKIQRAFAALEMRAEATTVASLLKRIERRVKK